MPCIRRREFSQEEDKWTQIIAERFENYFDEKVQLAVHYSHRECGSRAKSHGPRRETQGNRKRAHQKEIHFISSRLPLKTTGYPYKINRTHHYRQGQEQQCHDAVPAPKQAESPRHY